MEEDEEADAKEKVDGEKRERVKGSGKKRMRILPPKFLFLANLKMRCNIFMEKTQSNKTSRPNMQESKRLSFSASHQAFQKAT